MAGKRGHNEGSIRLRKDGRYEGRVTIGYADGKQQRKSVFGKSRAECSEKMKKVQGDMARGIMPVADERLTVKVFLTRWLEDAAQPSLRGTTYASYRGVVNGHLIPALGHIALVKLTAPDVMKYQRTKLASGLSARTVTYHRAILRRALSDAAKWELAHKNAAALASPPRAVRHDVSPLTPDEARTFLSKIPGNRLEALYVMAMGTGMRQGELLGLTWKNVDLDNGTATVRQQMQRINGKLTLVEPKTAKSRRTVALPNIVVTALAAHRERQKFERRWAGSRWQEHGLVFTTTIGTPLDSANVTHNFQKALSDAKIRKQRFHDLRHCAATLLLAQGADLRTIMDVLGHSTITLTANTYAHLTDATRRVAADMMDDVMKARA
jgi:integrase